MTTPRTCSGHSRRSCAGGDSRPPCGSRSTAGCPPTSSTSSPRAAARRAARPSARRPARPGRPVEPRLRSIGPTSSTRRSIRHSPPRWSATPDGRRRHLRHARPAGPAGPPPLRLVRGHRPGVHRAGGGRPDRARHQADPVPDLGREPDRRRADRRGARPASRSSCWSRSRPASTSRPTSPGPGCWSRPAATSCTGWWGLKTHCKLASSSATSRDGIRRYVHIGTGNYHPTTARLYEDLGLLTADPRACRRRQPPVQPADRLFAPVRLRLPDRRPARPAPAHGEHDRTARPSAPPDGRPARIAMKMNSLVDEAIIDALYAPRAPASRSTSSCAGSAPCGRASRA